MRSSCIVLLLAGLIALVIESSDSVSLVHSNAALEELKLLRELVESFKRAKDVKEHGNGRNGGNGPDGGNGDDLGPSPSDETGTGTEIIDDETEGGEPDMPTDGDNGSQEGDQGDQTASDGTETPDGADGGAQETPNESNGEEEGETPTNQDSEAPTGPTDTEGGESSGPEREGLVKDFVDFLARSKEQVKEKVYDIIAALKARNLKAATAKVEKLLDDLKAMSEDATKLKNFLDAVIKHLSDEKNSLDDIANDFDAAEGQIRIGEDLKPLDNEESERQAKGEVGVPVARAVGGGPVQVGVPVARVVGGGPVEVGEPVARAVGDGPIDKRAQFLREIQLFNLIQKLKNAAKK